MSSTNRGAKRVTLDAYYTPDAVAVSCVAATPIADHASVLEPHAGGGAFLRALVRPGRKVAALDINPDAPGLRSPGIESSEVDDFLTWDPGQYRPDWTVGNPPFVGAEAHVRRALSLSRVGCAFLLRLAFLESAERVPFWRDHPPATVLVFNKRPSFTGGKTDSCAYGWFIWRKAWTARAELGWLKW